MQQLVWEMVSPSGSTFVHDGESLSKKGELLGYWQMYAFTSAMI